MLTAGAKSYSYDGAGNTTAVSNSATGTTTTLTWDGEERLKTVSGGGVSNVYVYNGLDQRSGKADSGGTFSFLRAGDGIASPVLSDGAATYNYGSGLTSEVRSGTSKFYQADGLGSTRELTNSVGAVTDAHETDAFGNTVASSGSTPSPFGFAGQAGYQTDFDTGLKLLGHRYYDSSTGRFISRDPIQDGNNWYAYCGNDPVNRLDAEGLADAADVPQRGIIDTFFGHFGDYADHVKALAAAATAATVGAGLVKFVTEGINASREAQTYRDMLNQVEKHHPNKGDADINPEDERMQERIQKLLNDQKKAANKAAKYMWIAAFDLTWKIK